MLKVLQSKGYLSEPYNIIKSRDPCGQSLLSLPQFAEYHFLTWIRGRGQRSFSPPTIRQLLGPALQPKSIVL